MDGGEFVRTFAITVRSASDFDSPLAMSMAVVSQAVPSMTLPSGSVTWMGERGFAANSSSSFFLSSSNKSKRHCRYSGGGVT